MRYGLLFLVGCLCCGAVRAQGSVVEPGPHHTLIVDGRPFFPLGWNGLGECADWAADPTALKRDSTRAHLEMMRRYGINTILEQTQADGRVVALAASRNWYNWQSYSYQDVDGRRKEAGHPRPGAYVEGLRWLMDAAYDADPDQRIYTLVSLTGFMLPKHDGEPYDTYDRLRCDEYRALIEDERAHQPASIARGIPPVACARGEARPLWEWNVRYVVQSLRDHPGLLGWYLWDEPEGTTYRYLFGIPGPRRPAPRYTGPASLPTPDFLRYAYRLVRDTELDGAPDGFRRHPVVVDVANPEIFFSDRFSWSNEGDLRAEWSSGPFDRAPGGGFDTPADVLGLEASAVMGYTGGRGRTERHQWFFEQGLGSRFASMLDDATRRDDLWAAIVVAAQAQLPDRGGYAIAEPLRCSPNDELRARLLNDRDLVWQLLTSGADGMRGYLYYIHYLLPRTGPGAQQGRRSNRLIRQFQQARLDQALLAPEAPGWAAGEVLVTALTDYVRSDPAFVGPVVRYDPGRSVHSSMYRVAAEDYIVRRFGRDHEEANYGQPKVDGHPVIHHEHRHLRMAVHRFEGDDYVFISNNYDARIDATVSVERPPLSGGPTVEESLFDLDPEGAFRWADPERLTARHGARLSGLTITLEPYEARVFRVRYGE